MFGHPPPFAKGHCRFCDLRLSASTAEPSSLEAPVPCIYRGEDLQSLSVVRGGFDVRRSYNECRLGLGFPAGVVCSCHCGPMCKSYSPVQG